MTRKIISVAFVWMLGCDRVASDSGGAYESLLPPPPNSSIVFSGCGANCRTEGYGANIRFDGQRLLFEGLLSSPDNGAFRASGPLVVEGQALSFTSDAGRFRVSSASSWLVSGPISNVSMTLTRDAGFVVSGVGTNTLTAESLTFSGSGQAFLTCGATEQSFVAVSDWAQNSLCAPLAPFVAP